MQTQKRISHPHYQFNPVPLGIILIIFVTFYFIWRTSSEKQKDKELERKLNSEQYTVDEIDAKTASAEEVYQWINNKNIQLIDIRNSSEFLIKHIESSVNIPLDDLTKNLKKVDKTKKIIIIDKVDSEKGKILTEHLKKEGLDSKYLIGGILNYAQKNYPLITTGNPASITDQMKASLITAQQVKDTLISGKIFSFIDTRSKGAYKSDYIDGSINIPLSDIETSKAILPPHTILLFDNDPTRSFKAGVKLYDLGISNVYSCSDNYTILKKILFTDAPVINEPNKNKEDLQKNEKQENKKEETPANKENE